MRVKATGDMKYHGTSEEKYIELLGQIEDTRDGLRRAAYESRHCKKCAEGWVSSKVNILDNEYDEADRCRCYINWSNSINWSNGIS